jgi:hypothetical protein
LIAILVAAFVAGCGGGSPSTETAKLAAAVVEEEENEAGGIVEVQTAPPRHPGRRNGRGR